MHSGREPKEKNQKNLVKPRNLLTCSDISTANKKLHNFFLEEEEFQEEAEEEEEKTEEEEEDFAPTP